MTLLNCYEEADKVYSSSFLFKLAPQPLNLLSRCLNLFFFYQGDVEELLSTHDYGFLKYEQFKSYASEK